MQELSSLNLIVFKFNFSDGLCQILLLLYSLVIISNIALIRAKFAEKIKDAPEIIFDQFNEILFFLLKFALVNNVWFCQARIQSVIDIHAKPNSWKVCMTFKSANEGYYSPKVFVNFYSMIVSSSCILTPKGLLPISVV